MKTCNKCNRQLKSKAGLTNHQKVCRGIGTTRASKNARGKSWTCPKCSKHIHSRRQRHVEICDGKGPGAHRRGGKHAGKGRGWNKGLPVPDSTRAKISAALKGKSTGKASTPEAEILRRAKISETMKKNPNAGGYRTGSGVGKGSWHESNIAGRVWLDSTYEKRYAVLLDNQKIDWQRNSKSFEYVDENGRTRKYIPDFYLPEAGVFIEIKGYETERDRCKWRDFPYKLNVLFESDIIKIETTEVQADR
jgi:hypothetical protein